MSKRYYDDDGGLFFVSMERGTTLWVTMQQKKVNSGIRRIVSPKLPGRSSKEDAQKDLDAYAQMKKWDLVAD